MSFDLKISSMDLVINSTGDLQQVVDTEKLIQDILKICLTEVGTNVLQPWYGSFLSRTVIGSAQQTNMLVQVAQSQLGTALGNLQQLQQIQVKSLQNVSADEQISAISNISVTRNQIDPRLFSVKLSILTKGLKPITTAFNVNTI